MRPHCCVVQPKQYEYKDKRKWNEQHLGSLQDVVRHTRSCESEKGFVPNLLKRVTCTYSRILPDNELSRAGVWKGKVVRDGQKRRESA